MVRRGVIVCIALAMVGLAVLARPAAAQVIPPGYPGPTSTVPPEPSNEEQDAGTVRAGQTVVIESCGFDPTVEDPAVPGVGPIPETEVDRNPERTVEVTWNGEDVGSAVVGSDGCARVEVSVHDRRGEVACPATDVNGRTVMARRGRNALVVRGVGTNGEARTVTTRVSISCSNGGGAGDAAGAGAGSSDGAASAGGGDGELLGDPGVRAGETIASSTPRLSTVARSTPLRWGAVTLLVLGVAGAAAFGERLRRARRIAL